MSTDVPYVASSTWQILCPRSVRTSKRGKWPGGRVDCRDARTEWQRRERL